MSFKKLKQEVVDALKYIQIESLEDDAKVIFSTIKSGKNSLIIAPTASGKTTAALVSIFNRVNEEFEGSPRAIYLTDSIEKAEQFHKKAAIVSRRLDITSDFIHDKGNMVQQRNDIFDGTEIVIGNPKRIYELYLQNGINLKLLDLFIVDNLSECLSNGRQMELKRLIESLEQKTQLVLLTDVMSKKTEAFVDALETPVSVFEL